MTNYCLAYVSICQQNNPVLCIPMWQCCGKSCLWYYTTSEFHLETLLILRPTCIIIFFLRIELSEEFGKGHSIVYQKLSPFTCKPRQCSLFCTQPKHNNYENYISLKYLFVCKKKVFDWVLLDFWVGVGSL